MSKAVQMLALGTVMLIAACKETAQPAFDDGTGLSETFDRDTLTIENDDGEQFVFDVYLALEYEQKRQGLMFVRQMPETTGMLFVYGRPGVQSIWMKNTYIPLDIIFVRADNRISSIDHNAAPLTLNSRSSTEAVKYVIELNGGVAKKYNIGTGSRIIWGAGEADRE